MTVAIVIDRVDQLGCARIDRRIGVVAVALRHGETIAVVVDSRPNQHWNGPGRAAANVGHGDRDEQLTCIERSSPARPIALRLREETHVFEAVLTSRLPKIGQRAGAGRFHCHGDRQTGRNVRVFDLNRQDLGRIRRRSTRPAGRRTCDKEQTGQSHAGEKEGASLRGHVCLLPSSQLQIATSAG